MVERDLYERLVERMSKGVTEFPKGLVVVLKEWLSEKEASVALSLPCGRPPCEIEEIDKIAEKVDLEYEELSQILEDMANKGMLYSRLSENGKPGYALLQIGYGFPQSFYWNKKKPDEVTSLGKMLANYWWPRMPELVKETYTKTSTKNFRYIPIQKSLSSIGPYQEVPSHERLVDLIESANLIAVTHCPCRLIAEINGQGCGHPREVCMKYDEMARYVIDRGLGKEIPKQEALDIMKMCQEAGLVQLIENSQSKPLHTCFCCGCCCWSLRPINMGLPRDGHIATYFLRTTESELCIGCDACVEPCPVNALISQGGNKPPLVNENLCVGCGVCIPRCPTEAARMKKKGEHLVLFQSRQELFGRMLKEKGVLV